MAQCSGCFKSSNVLFCTPRCTAHSYCSDCLKKKDLLKACQNCHKYFKTIGSTNYTRCNLCSDLSCNNKIPNCDTHKYCDACYKFIRNNLAIEFGNIKNCPKCKGSLSRNTTKEESKLEINGQNPNNFSPRSNSNSQKYISSPAKTQTTNQNQGTSNKPAYSTKSVNRNSYTQSSEYQKNKMLAKFMNTNDKIKFESKSQINDRVAKTQNRISEPISNTLNGRSLDKRNLINNEPQLKVNNLVDIKQEENLGSRWSTLNTRNLDKKASIDNEPQLKANNLFGIKEEETLGSRGNTLNAGNPNKKSSINNQQNLKVKKSVEENIKNKESDSIEPYSKVLDTISYVNPELIIDRRNTENQYNGIINSNVSYPHNYNVINKYSTITPSNVVSINNNTSNLDSLKVFNSVNNFLQQSSVSVPSYRSPKKLDNSYSIARIEVVCSLCYENTAETCFVCYHNYCRDCLVYCFVSNVYNHVNKANQTDGCYKFQCYCLRYDCQKSIRIPTAKIFKCIQNLLSGTVRPLNLSLYEEYLPLINYFFSCYDATWIPFFDGLIKK
jgi:hypothetical protein